MIRTRSFLASASLGVIAGMALARENELPVGRDIGSGNNIMIGDGGSASKPRDTGRANATVPMFIGDFGPGLNRRPRDGLMPVVGHA